MSCCKSGYRAVKYVHQRKRYLLVFSVLSIILLLCKRSGNHHEKIASTSTVVTDKTKTIVASIENAVAVVSENVNASDLVRRTITELESDGWVAPIGKGAIDRRIKKMKAGMPSFRPPEIAKQSEKILVKAERWKVDYIGCFSDPLQSPALKTPTHQMPVTSVTACIVRCQKLGLPYATVTSGIMCRCGKSISRHSVGLNISLESCKMKCRDVQDNRPCGGSHFASVYTITIHQRENLTRSTVADASSGCFIKPKTFNKIFGKKKIIVNGTAAHCLIHCEVSREAIAAWDQQLAECTCGQFTRRLPSQALRRSPVDGACDYKTCSTQYCAVHYVRIMRTYSQDKRCEMKSFLPNSNGSLTALVSFPGSGNTWLRHLIESATGIYSGSVYADSALYLKGFLGEVLPWKSRKMSVIKTHDGSSLSASRFEAAIILIRSPYDAFVAEFNRIAGGHIGHADPVFFKTKEWHYYVVYKLGKWLDVINYFSQVKNVHVTYFEDVVMNPTNEIRAMMNFLNIAVANREERFQCVVSNLKGSFKRTSRTLDFDPFTTTMKKNVNAFVKKARDILEKRGLPTLPYYERL